MKKIMLKSFSLLFVIMAVFAISSFPAHAAYSYYGSYNFSAGPIWSVQNYTAKVYRDPSYFCIFSGNSSVSTGFYYKGNTSLTLSQTRTFSLGSQSKYTLNGSINFSDYGVPANVGGSIEKTAASSWTVSNTSSVTIPSYAPKGYYSFNVCLNVSKIKITRYQGSTAKGTIQFLAPRSQPYRSVVYNTNADYAGAIKY